MVEGRGVPVVGDAGTPVRDGYRPHRFPLAARDDEVLAWECQACGEWVREYGPRVPDDCPVDWRNNR